MFHFHNGFSSIQELTESLELKGFIKSKYVIIKTNAMFYAVCIDSCSRIIVFGKEVVWFKDKQGFFKAVPFEEFVAPYSIRIRKTNGFNNTLATELVNQDKNLEVFLFRKKNEEEPMKKAYRFHASYVVTLAQTFRDDFFSVDELESKMNLYFANPATSVMNGFVSKHQNIVSVNPFKSLLKLADGTIVPYRTYFEMGRMKHNL